MTIQDIPQIKKGQLWRNREKNYTIKVVAKIKKGIWKVSAHGKGSTTHGMEDKSFHFYELLSEGDVEQPTEEEKMNITDVIKFTFNDKIECNDMFSVDSFIDLLVEEEELKDVKRDKIKSSLSDFISDGCITSKIIKKHIDKRKISSSKKGYQKLKNINISKDVLDLEVNINNTFFKNVFNNQLETGQSFSELEFGQYVFVMIGGDKLNDEKRNIIEVRISSFIKRYIKKGYIDETESQLTKVKNIDSGMVAECEDTSDDILEKFASMPMDELIDCFVIFFNIMQEKEKDQREIIDSLKSKIEGMQCDKENIEPLKDILKRREEKIISLNKKIGSFKEKIKQLESDIKHQLAENEKLQDANNEFVTIKTDEKDEPTDAWKSLNIEEMSVV